MEWVIIILGIIFVWLIINHPLELDKVKFRDKYSYYLKKFKQQRNKEKKKRGRE
jgi:hypothetical protein